MKASYEEQTDVRYAAARLWVDASSARGHAGGLADALAVATRHDDGRAFKTGVLQV